MPIVNFITLSGLVLLLLLLGWLLPIVNILFRFVVHLLFLSFFLSLLHYRDSPRQIVTMNSCRLLAPSSSYTPSRRLKSSHRSREQISSLSGDSRDHTVENTETSFLLSVDLPGVKAADLSVTCKEGVLKITGTRRRTSTPGAKQQPSSFMKSFAVNQHAVDFTKLTANLSDGVLVVNIPKKPKPVARTFTITQQSPPAANKAEDF
jgi:HSP20 family molecular chaperone IbpA